MSINKTKKHGSRKHIKNVNKKNKIKKTMKRNMKNMKNTRKKSSQRGGYFGKCDNNKKLFGISQCHPEYRILKDAFLFDIKDKDKDRQKSIRKNVEDANCKDYYSCGEFVKSNDMLKTSTVLVNTFKWNFPKEGDKDFRSTQTGKTVYSTTTHRKPSNFSTYEEGTYSMPNPQTNKGFYNTKKPVQDSESVLKKDIKRIYDNLMTNRDTIGPKMHYFDIIIICVYLMTKYPISFYNIPKINSNTIVNIVTTPYSQNEKDKQTKYKEILHAIFSYSDNNYNYSSINTKVFTSSGINDSYMWWNKYYMYLFDQPNNEKNNEVCENLLKYLYNQLNMTEKTNYLKDKHSIRYDIKNLDFNNNNLKNLPCTIQQVYKEPIYAIPVKKGHKSSSSEQLSYAPPRPTASKPTTYYAEDEES